MVSMLHATCDVSYSQPSTGTPCDVMGDDLEPGLLPPSHDHVEVNYLPFHNQAEFELADLLYVEEEMSAGKMNKLLKVLLTPYNAQPPFTNYQELYTLIDVIK
jgi:hypothetical protein